MSSSRSDNIRPPLRSTTLQPLARPPIRSLSHDFSQIQVPPQRQVSFDLSTLRSLESPAKRIKLEHDSFLKDTRGGKYPDIIDLEYQGIGLVIDSKAEDGQTTHPPFPSRLGADSSRPGSPRAQLVQERPAVSEKAYVLEAPSIAPKYANKEAADFFPWTGDKAEDNLNDQTIKNGYFDKPANLQTESLSARPAIWPKFRHKSGLEMFSSLFVTALQQRQKFGAVSAASTFKPPPRATLTEPKREIWLKDLADSKIPLRRLSRTIPHGVRGKTLLDQCMAKQIPPERAIWLVKCVGANEIRAFKRKGPNMLASGGEAKWVLEWTGNIQEYLETLIESCGTESWGENVKYGLQLVANIYSEGLLDKEKFLEWIVLSLQAAANHNLPIWLLMADMYWREITLCRKFGRKLAIALCEQTNRLHDQVVPAIQVLWDKLSEMIIRLMTQSPACLLLPEQWPSYSALLKTIALEHGAVFENTQKHNERLANFACMPQIRSASQKIIDLLDSSDASYDIKKTSRKCLLSCSDLVLLVSTTCRWATTIYRPGFANIYLALRLVRRWAKPDLDIEPLIFTFVRSCCDVMDLDKPKLYKLVAELIRSKHLSVSKYLQWIMAQGDLLALEKELLLQIPLHDLPDHTRNLCQMVLRCHLPQSLAVYGIQDTISERLFNDAMVDEDLDIKPISALCLSEQYQLARWLRHLLFSHVDDDGLLTNFEDLKTICQILETIHDYAVFADVLGVYAESGDTSLLAVILDTINMHFECLQAIGATDRVCDIILQRMEEVPDRTTAQKPLILSLVDLVEKLPRRSKTLAVLQKELFLCEPKSAIAACSPVSDAMGDTQENVTFFEEIEILFGSGTSMDRTQLTRIFTDIAKRLETSWTDDLLTSINLAELLLRLKSFNVETFATLMPQWIDTILARHHDVKTVLAILVCEDLLEVQELYKRTISQVKVTKAFSNATLTDLLDLLLETPNIPRSYRLRADILFIIRNDPQIVAQFLALVLDRIGPDMLLRSGLRELVLSLSVSNEAVQNFFPKSKPALLADLVLGSALDSDFIRSLPRSLSCFNSTLCAQKLKKILDEDKTQDLTELSPNIITQVTLGTLDPVEPWKAILKSLPDSMKLQMHKLITSSFLDSTAERTAEDINTLLRFLGILQHGMDSQELASVITILADSLSKLQSSLPQSNGSGDFSISSVGPHLLILLRLLSIHASILTQARIPSSTMLRLCLVLTSLYLDPVLSADSTIKTILSDTITLLSDVITNEVREQTIYALTQHNLSSPHLNFLLGPLLQSNADLNLRLISLSPNDVPFSQDRSKSLGKTPSHPSSRTLTTKEAQPSSSHPFTLHRWEMVQDATPVIGDNDTSLSLALFGARKAVL